MSRPCCFPKRFKNLVLCQFFAPVLSCCVHVVFQNVSITWCFPRVLRMLLSCCIRVASKTFQEPGVFPGFCACCFHDESMMLSKTVQEPVVFPGFAHVAFMLNPCWLLKCFNNLVFSRFLRVLFACWCHVAPMLLSENVSRPLCFPRFLHMFFMMLRPCCFPTTFQEPDVFPGFCTCFFSESYQMGAPFCHVCGNTMFFE